MEKLVAQLSAFKAPRGSSFDNALISKLTTLFGQYAYNVTLGNERRFELRRTIQEQWKVIAFMFLRDQVHPACSYEQLACVEIVGGETMINEVLELQLFGMLQMERAVLRGFRLETMLANGQEKRKTTNPNNPKKFRSSEPPNAVNVNDVVFSQEMTSEFVKLEEEDRQEFLKDFNVPEEQIAVIETLISTGEPETLHKELAPLIATAWVQSKMEEPIIVEEVDVEKEKLLEELTVATTAAERTSILRMYIDSVKEKVNYVLRKAHAIYGWSKIIVIRLTIAAIMETLFTYAEMFTGTPTETKFIANAIVSFVWELLRGRTPQYAITSGVAGIVFQYVASTQLFSNFLSYFADMTKQALQLDTGVIFGTTYDHYVAKSQLDKLKVLLESPRDELERAFSIMYNDAAPFKVFYEKYRELADPTKLIPSESLIYLHQAHMNTFKTSFSLNRLLSFLENKAAILSARMDKVETKHIVLDMNVDALFYTNAATFSGDGAISVVAEKNVTSLLRACILVFEELLHYARACIQGEKVPDDESEYWLDLAVILGEEMYNSPRRYQTFAFRQCAQRMLANREILQLALRCFRTGGMVDASFGMALLLEYFTQLITAALLDGISMDVILNTLPQIVVDKEDANGYRGVYDDESLDFFIRSI